MTLPFQEHRRADVKLHAAIQDVQIDNLTSALAQIDAVEEFRISDQNIYIEYIFPLVSYSDIWAVLMQSIDKNRLSYIQFLYNSFRAYVEENEQAHLTRQYGWEMYIRNIYITYFQGETLVTGSRQPGHILANARALQLKEKS